MLVRGCQQERNFLNITGYSLSSSKSYKMQIKNLFMDTYFCMNDIHLFATFSLRMNSDMYIRMKVCPSWNIVYQVMGLFNSASGERDL